LVPFIVIIEPVEDESPGEELTLVDLPLIIKSIIKKLFKNIY